MAQSTIRLGDAPNGAHVRFPLSDPLTPGYVATKVGSWGKAVIVRFSGGLSLDEAICPATTAVHPCNSDMKDKVA